ncbi:MAG: OmpH family outer membrane protein [bacterium]|nr:OmpH family outer membrane protein [bacterium]
MSDVENSATESAQPVAETGKAASAPKGDKKVIISVVVVVLLLAVGVVAWLAYRPDGFAQSPAKRVGCIDADAIYSLEEFKNAEKQIKDFSDAKTKEFEKAVKEKNGKEGAENELQLLYNKFQNEYEVNRNKIMLPLNNRAQAAIASVAASKGLYVVLDKRIVVCGVPDITEDVKKVFQQKGELKIPKEEDTSKSPVAYFDQSIVRKLKVFGEVDIRLSQARADMMREYEKKAPSLSASEKEALQREMTARFEALSQQQYTPLYQKVNNSVNKVAKDLGISLVLNKQTVMYGGRNITDEVIDTFTASLNEAGGTAAGQSAGGAAPSQGASQGSGAGGASTAPTSK